MTATWVDGNELAGMLQEVLAVDVTVAMGRCAGCGLERVIAQAKVFDRAPGWVARCSGCGNVLLRLVRAPERMYLDLRGLSCLVINVAEAAP